MSGGGERVFREGIKAEIPFLNSTDTLMHFNGLFEWIRESLFIMFCHLIEQFSIWSILQIEFMSLLLNLSLLLDKRDRFEKRKNVDLVAMMQMECEVKVVKDSRNVELM